MKRGKYKIFKWIGWVLGSFFALILLITISFYLGRGWIMKRAVIYLNQNQPGEVHIGQMNLLPLMDFPNSVVQFRDISWYENPVRPDSLHQEPILSIHKLNLSLDIVELIRGDIKVDQFRLKNGFVRIEVYQDSLMNLEKALGIRFGESPSPQSETTDSLMRVDIDKIELINFLVLYQDHTSGDALNIQINRLESQFSLFPDIVNSDIELNVDINSIKYQKYNIENKKDVKLSSHILFDLEKKSIVIEPSVLSISGLELETWGKYEFFSEPFIDIAFRATNTGLDVLNFLFLGVLDLDEIEQIGSGSIRLDGNVTGVLGKQVPVIRVNGIAQGIGFRIKPIERDVSDISFALFATNGGRADFSEGQVELRGFTASFPEGTVHGDIMAKNLVRPEIDLELKGELVLDGLDHMIKMEMLRSVEGHVSFDCNLAGIVDRTSNRFLDEAGSMKLSMDRVGVVYGKDTLSLDGTLYMEGNEVGARGLHLVFNGSQAALEVKTLNIVQYMLDYDKDVDIKIALASDRILPGRMTRDSLITGLLGEEITGLHFKAEASITGKELDAFLEQDTIPAFNLTLDSFGIELPVYANISDLNASIAFDTDTLTLHYLNGIIGESGFSFSGRMINLEAFINKDSGEIMSFDYNLSSPRLRAEDLLSYKSSFLLPESYRSEHMEDFNLTGSAQFPVEALIYDSVDLDFGVEVTNIGWHFRYYPMAIEQFRVKVNKQGKALRIDNLEGNIGESNLKLTALIGNFADSSLENLYGNLNLKSDLLDFNQLLNYQLPDEMADPETADSSEILNPPRLDQMEFPDFTFNLDVGELRYGENTIYGLRGTLRSTTEKVLFMDNLVVSAESGGSLGFNGQFNVANPFLYNLSAQMEMKDLNITDLNFQMQSGEEVYTLKENFAGILSGSGLAEVFITPDLNLDMEQTTALFQLEVKDGALINFTPLKAAGKYLNNRDLDHVRFSTLRNSFTLMDSRIIIPLMVVESTIGQILIEGEQGLDFSYLYLLRVPPWLVKDAARSTLRKKGDDEKEDEIKKMKMGNFVVMTIWSDGVESLVELKDQREKYRK